MPERSNYFSKLLGKIVSKERNTQPVTLSAEQNAREVLLDAEIGFRFKNEHSLPQMERVSGDIWRLHIAGKSEGAESEGIALNEGQPTSVEDIQREMDQYPEKPWRGPKS